MQTGDTVILTHAYPLPVIRPTETGRPNFVDRRKFPIHHLLLEEYAMKKYLTKQWSFLWAGVAFGIAQIIYLIGTMIPKWAAGETPKVKPMTVTSDLGKMFRGVEVWLSHTFGFADPQIYGKSTEVGGETISNGGAFYPGIGWIIFGMMIGGLLVAVFERDSRVWVKYSKKMLLTSFIGGIIFSYGTRLAGGCTLNHLLGGVPMMSIHSLVAIVFMSIGGLSAFLLMGKLNLAQNFKHQNTRSYSKAACARGDTMECANYDPDYKPAKRLIFWVSLTFLVIFFGVAVYGGLFAPEFLGHLKDGALKPFNKSIAHEGLAYVVITLIAGIVAGFGMAKSGFGTECALVSAEASSMIKKDEGKFAKMGLPRITRTLFKGLLPLQGVVAAWVITLAGIIFFWGFLGYKHGFSGSVKYQLTAGVPIGALLLGAGAVLLIGCEIRSYMRLGLGYLNTWVGFMGFAIGYLPFTLFYEQHKAFLQNTVMVEKYIWPELFTASHSGQVIIAIIFWLALAWLLVYLIKLGAKNTNTSVNSVINKNTEELQLEIDGLAAKAAD